MIEVKNLTKYYGSHIALDDVSFKVKEGEILGFLGPNGAGKSTTMNIITGYLSASDGNVIVNGHDILEEPSAAKTQIGYLPEIPPLYDDMTVQKYLEFIFGLKKLKLPMKEHINKICQSVKITDVQNRIIKHLSKGYRQRIGLAQALLGDPPILILDEPTAGLDPAQIVEVRRFIRSLSKKHTVILSSHILSEVQAICDRIVVINNGKIAVNDLTSNLSRKVSGENNLNVVIEGNQTSVYNMLKGISGVNKVIRHGMTEQGCYEYTLCSDEKTDIRRPVFRTLARSNYALLSMYLDELSLEDIFMRILSENTETREVKKS
ncbi:MAG: ABC transporter ATP-binding protein [Acutalibacteraceae bacterium]